MSGLISGLVFKHYPGTGGELLTALKLADNADDKGRRIFPSIATLATDTRQSERTVQRQLRHMVAMGWLQMVRQARGVGRGGDCGRPREYRIHPDWVQQFDATVPEAARPRWCPIEPAAATPITAQKPPEQQPANAKEMGDKLTPIFSPPPVGKSVDNQYPTKEMGDIAVSEMGDTAVSPYPSLTSSNTEPPNPPMGGERVFQKPEQPPDPPSALTGVATFLALWPPSRRQRAAQVADAIAAIAAAGGPGIAQLADAARTTAQAQGDRWHADGGRWAVTPMRWLRERRWLDAQAQQPSAGQGAATTTAAASAHSSASDGPPKLGPIPTPERQAQLRALRDRMRGVQGKSIAETATA